MVVFMHFLWVFFQIRWFLCLLSNLLIYVVGACKLRATRSACPALPSSPRARTRSWTTCAPGSCPTTAQLRHRTRFQEWNRYGVRSLECVVGWCSIIRVTAHKENRVHTCVPQSSSEIWSILVRHCALSFPITNLIGSCDPCWWLVWHIQTCHKFLVASLYQRRESLGRVLTYKSVVMTDFLSWSRCMYDTFILKLQTEVIPKLMEMQKFRTAEKFVPFR